MDLKLHGKVALVAGSSRGLGFGVAKALAFEGARIHLGARDQESLREAAEALRMETGAEISFSPLDASISDSIAKWIARGAAEHGGIDLLVANAGPLSEIDEAAAKRLSIYRERLAASTVNAFHAWYAAGIRREILTFGGREKRERYLKSGMVLYEDAASGQLVMDSREPSASGPVWGVETFRELAWISADHYAGDQVFRGKKCHVYRSRALPSAPDINDSLGNEMQADEPEPMRWGDREGTTAFIDIETMLPVGMEMPNETWLYKIIGRQSTVQLPDVYAQKVQQMEERAKKLRNKYRVNQ
jgi:hypothetical protein